MIPTLYGLVLLVLLLAAWNPPLPGGKAAIDLMLVVDESESMGRQSGEKPWQEFLARAKKLPAGSRVSLLRFADRAGVEIPWTTIDGDEFKKIVEYPRPPRRVYLDPGASDIRSAIDLALQQLSTDRASVILLASDGIDTSGAQAPAPVFRAGSQVSIFHLRPQPQPGSPATRLDSINLPPAIDANRSLPVSISISAPAGTGASLEIVRNGDTVVEQTLLLQPGVPQVLRYDLQADRPGTQLLDFILRNPQQDIIDKQRRVTDAIGSGHILYIARAGADPVAATVPPRGWETMAMSPAQLTTAESFFDRFDVVIIDDLEADAINPVILRNLFRSVRQQGTGLIVIGGPHSFGSGAYRQSELEEILPVIAESSRPLPASAFLFLLDKSGSMEVAGNRQSRLADALRAVLESAKSIRAGDESALLAFDREVQTLLPLQRRADLLSELDRPWSLQPSGGTRLASALAEAIEALARSESPRRFLIVVTDGIVDIDDTATMENALREARIRLLALATGSDARLDKLRRLADASGGRVLQVSDSAQLPRFMRRQLETTRRSWSDSAVKPETTSSLPFIEQRRPEWQSLPGHQVTRAKASARVYLATPDGDPLLAVGRYGAGAVAALLGGIPEARSSGTLAPALIGWLNGRRQNPNLRLRQRYASGLLHLVVDAVAADGSWHSTTPATVTLTGPNGNSQQHPLELTAPGRYSAAIRVSAAGVYRARLEIGDRPTLYSLLVESDAERRENRIAPWFQGSLERGDIEQWNQAAVDAALARPGIKRDSTTLWLTLALAGFAGLIASERSAAFAWLKSRIASAETGEKRH